MKLNFVCGSSPEYKMTVKRMEDIEGIKIENLDVNNKILKVSGVNFKNYDEICIKLQEVGWRKLNI